MRAALDNPAATTMRRITNAYMVSDNVLRRRDDGLNMSAWVEGESLIRAIDPLAVCFLERQVVYSVMDTTFNTILGK